MTAAQVFSPADEKWTTAASLRLGAGRMDCGWPFRARLGILVVGTFLSWAAVLATGLALFS